MFQVGVSILGGERMGSADTVAQRHETRGHACSWNPQRRDASQSRFFLQGNGRPLEGGFFPIPYP